MKKTLFIISIIFLFAHDLYSQESINRGSNFKLKITPLTMIDITPRLRFGFELFSNKKLGYSVDFGIGSTSLNKWKLNGTIWGNDYSFFEIRPQIKYALKRNENKTFYCATEFMYLKMRDHLQSGHYQKENSNIETIYDNAIFNKQKTGIHLILGIDLKVFKRLNIDIYGGAGIAERKIKYSDVINPVEGVGPMFVEWLPQSYLFEGESVILHLTGGFKIGYTLWKKL